ncbi:EamA family transporter [Flavobacterium agricola]|uniref:EamA family transporter n=1 Tax=Flavobacterium agricola TaxID=2870839 RepID=A0ABY6M3R1_9FLAO|nr:EamA family transporter [Flavobacterium agricola]UYW02068.1 EamA family transporter [Flavobacterium agricola]
MYYLLISIFCSVSVAALFKWAKNSNVSVFSIIHFNYLLAIVYCYFLFDSNYYTIQTYADNLPIYALLGILLPTLFLILNKSILQVGIIKTDIAQRFSLLIPILVSVFVWNQVLNQSKIVGLALGFLAIFLILYKKGITKNTSFYFMPILVLLGYGLVDVLFKQIALIQNISYTSSLLFIFTLAFIISSVIALLKKPKVVYNLNTIKWGLLLGTLNFGNIYTYIKAHQVLKDNPTIVFVTMNLGVIILSTIVGYFIFKEKINKINAVGIVLALLAIYLITWYSV